jgi:hypothetical protein
VVFPLPVVRDPLQEEQREDVGLVIGWVNRSAKTVAGCQQPLLKILRRDQVAVRPTPAIVKTCSEERPALTAGAGLVERYWELLVMNSPTGEFSQPQNPS